MNQERFFLIGNDFTDLHALVNGRWILPHCLGGDQPDDVSGWVKKEAEVIAAEKNSAK